jgi:hypothetical protein
MYFQTCNSIDKIMADNNFDETTSNWFTGGTISHPKHDPIGFTAQISWSTLQTERKKVGLQLMSGIPVKMGPFIAENFWGDSDEIPEARYWFGYVNLVFSLGFHM